jgi:hypothetical protein
VATTVGPASAPAGERHARSPNSPSRQLCTPPSYRTGPYVPQMPAATPGVGALTPRMPAATPGVGALTPWMPAATPGVGALTPWMPAATPGVGALTPWMPRQRRHRDDWPRCPGTPGVTRPANACSSRCASWVSVVPLAVLLAACGTDPLGPCQVAGGYCTSVGYCGAEQFADWTRACSQGICCRPGAYPWPQDRCEAHGGTCLESLGTLWCQRSGYQSGAGACGVPGQEGPSYACCIRVTSFMDADVDAAGQPDVDVESAPDAAPKVDGPDEAATVADGATEAAGDATSDSADAD